MPVDLQLTFKDGTSEMHYIPLNLMFGGKQNENPVQPFIVHEEWRWTHPVYIGNSNTSYQTFRKAEIDPSRRMADVERKNNYLELNW